MTKDIKEKEIKRLLRDYYSAINTAPIVALCSFIFFEKPELLDQFKKYLVDEKILDDSDNSIYLEHVIDKVSPEIDSQVAYSIRALVLEDFLTKYL